MTFGFLQKLVAALAIAVIGALLVANPFATAINVDIGAMVLAMLLFAIVAVVVVEIDIQPWAAWLLLTLAAIWLAFTPLLDSMGRIRAGAMRKASLWDYVPKPSFGRTNAADDIFADIMAQRQHDLLPFFARWWFEFGIPAVLIALAFWFWRRDRYYY